MKNNLLNEGGSGGHMFHPFNLPSVNTGTDLIDFFYKAAEFLSRNPEKIIPSDSSSLKVDGANTAFKLVRGPSGLEFAFDRGSMFPIDIEGITIDRLVDPDGTKTTGRWPAEHGMVAMGRIMLGALNRAIPKIKNELVDLGLLSKDGIPDSTKFINCEFCWKETNAVKYEEDFIALHGINQYYEKDYRGVHRPGAVRPLIKDEKSGKMKPTKQTSTEINYDENALESLKNKILPFFRDAKGPKNPEGFNVYTVIPVYLKDAENLVSKIEAKLEEPFTINFRRRSSELNEWNVDEGSGSATMPLREWLTDRRTINPRAIFIKMADGSKKGAMSKEVYGNILGGTPVEELVEDPESFDVAAAVNGALFYYAIENIGASILEGLTSPLGDMITDNMAHEGVVLRNEELFGVKMVKITGNFITAGSAGKFAQDRSQLPLSASERENEPEQGDLEPTGEENVEGGARPFRIAMFPGAFKPPHKGHLNMAERLAKNSGIDKVQIIISSPLKNQRSLPNGKVIDAETSKLIWQQLISNSDIPNAEAHVSPGVSPMQLVYDYVMKDPDPNDELVAPLGAEVFLGCGDKGDDRMRYEGLIKKAREDLKIRIVVCPLDERHDSSYVELLNANPEIKAQVPSTKESGLNFQDFHGKDMRFFAALAGESEVGLQLFSSFVPEGDALPILGILGINPAGNTVTNQPDAEEVNSDSLLEMIENIFLQEDFQTKMKSRLCKAHDWFLHQGRKDLTKHGGGFHLDPPKCKSNAFLAKEGVVLRFKKKTSCVDLEEMSSMAAGNVAIAAGNAFNPEEEKEKRSSSNK